MTTTSSRCRTTPPTNISAAPLTDRAARRRWGPLHSLDVHCRTSPPREIAWSKFHAL